LCDHSNKQAHCHNVNGKPFCPCRLPSPDCIPKVWNLHQNEGSSHSRKQAQIHSRMQTSTPRLLVLLNQ